MKQRWGVGVSGSARRRTFERVAVSLRLGSQFAWNAFAFDHHIADRLDGEHQDEPIPHTSRYAVGDNRIDITLDNGAKSSGGQPRTNGLGSTVDTEVRIYERNTHGAQCDASSQ
jgi:hypothetical protein